MYCIYVQQDAASELISKVRRGLKHFLYCIYICLSSSLCWWYARVYLTKSVTKSELSWTLSHFLPGPDSLLYARASLCLLSFSVAEVLGETKKDIQNGEREEEGEEVRGEERREEERKRGKIYFLLCVSHLLYVLPFSSHLSSDRLSQPLSHSRYHTPPPIALSPPPIAYRDSSTLERHKRSAYPCICI